MNIKKKKKFEKLQFEKQSYSKIRCSHLKSIGCFKKDKVFQ